MGSLRVAVLGTAEIVVDGERREISAAKHRALLSVLALHGGQRVSVDTIVDALWGDAPPPGASSTLQGYVADLRRLLEPGRAPREPARILVTVSSGYALRLPPEDLDVTNFEEQVRRAARLLQAVDLTAGSSPSPLRRDELVDVLAGLDEAVADWRGEPLADLDADPGVVAERDRLRALLVDAQVLRATAALSLGKHGEVASDLEGLARANPWNERLWSLWAVALAGSGRQAQALSCLRDLATSLREELGIEPTNDVRSLETAILRQELAPVPAEPAAAPVVRAAPAEPWPLIGRDDELDRFRRWLGRAGSGRPQALHLTGEHGIGKSRLTRELAAVARESGFRVASVQCRNHTRSTPFWAWRRLAQDLHGGADLHPAEPWDAASLVVDRLDGPEPVLVIVDDVHCADDATLEALDHLLREQHPFPVLVAVTQRMRTQPASPAMSSLLATLASGHAEHVLLTGLGSDAAGKLIGAVCGARPHPRVTERVRDRMDGNPFLLIEVARAGDFTPEALPGPVRVFLGHHLSRLPEATLDLLAPASLLPRTWDADLLAMAAGIELDDLFATMASAVVAGILVEERDDRYTFTHEVVRELMTSRLSQHAKARWHAAFATVLQERTPLDRADRRAEMDQHWRLAGYPFARRAWQAQVGAARLALADGLADEASLLLEHAVASLQMDRDASNDDHRIVTDLQSALEGPASRATSSAPDPVRSA